MSSMAQGSRPSERVLVIGLDGATFRLIDPWVAESRLPVLDRLLRTGVRARLRSTVQAESATAWATMITGVNLAKHGIYAFVHRERATGRLQVINATHLRAERIWDILGRHGRQVVVINVPITYPPSQVNGMLVSGMLTPDLNRTFTYPPELGKELLAKVPGYTITVDRAAYLPGSKGEDLFLTELARSIEKRKEATLYLLQKQAWDFGMVVFTAPDRLQHFYWAAMDTRHPLHSQSDPRLRTSILHLYQQLDRAIGEILDVVGPDVHAIVLSDHGFTGWGKYLYLNDWLVDQGLLHLRRRSPSPRRRLRQNLGRVRALRQMKSLATRLSPGLVNRLIGPRLSSRQDLLYWEMVDWSRTRAYVDADRGLHINLKGREKEGIVHPGAEYEALRDMLIARLSELIDPDTGYRVVQRVYRREELYEGPYFEEAPDLIVEPVRDRDDYWGNYAEHGLNPAGTGQVFVPASRLTGNHTRDGIFIAAGPVFQSGMDLGMVDITDVAPTVLYLLGIPLPTNLDGKVLEEALIADFKTEHPLQFEDQGGELLDRDQIPSDIFSDAEAEELTNRLRGLGYLG